MSTPPPRVSVVIPLFNEPPAILEVSLASIVGQDFTDYEVLIVDESTSPESSEACQHYCALDPRFHYIRPSQRIGLAASLNLAISRARGTYVARFDSDDRCLPGRLAMQVAYLDQHPDIGVVGGALEIISDDGRHVAVRHYPTDHPEIERKFMTTSALAHPTVMIRRTLIEHHGGYDPAFRYAEDLDLWLRLLGQGVRFANLPDVVVQYRQQQTRRSGEHWSYNLRARRRHFSFRHVVRRSLGIAAIAVWRFVPEDVQEHVFRRMMLRFR